MNKIKFSVSISFFLVFFAYLESTNSIRIIATEKNIEHREKKLLASNPAYLQKIATFLLLLTPTISTLNEPEELKEIIEKEIKEEENLLVPISPKESLSTARIKTLKLLNYYAKELGEKNEILKVRVNTFYRKLLKKLKKDPDKKWNHILLGEDKGKEFPSSIPLN